LLYSIGNLILYFEYVIERASTGKYGKQFLGLILTSLGILIATGVDKSLEAWILDHTAEWLTALTTKF
jgi:hypothetical protein